MEPPIRPDESDCCNSGCNPCILDVYEQQLKQYQATRTQKPNSALNCLSPTSYSVFELISVTIHTKDCNLYCFQYLRPQKPLSEPPTGLSVLYEPGQYLLLSSVVHGETFQKAYTPIYVEDEAPNRFTVLVKLYEDGRMSRVFRRLRPGMESLWRGPYGSYAIDYNLKNMLFIAQGTGLAPFYTIICDILRNEACDTLVCLFFCCQFENVLLHEHLYKLSGYWNFHYELFVSGSSDREFRRKYNETVHFSRLGVEHVRTYCDNRKGEGKVLVCGSERFEDDIKSVLSQCDISRDDIILF